MNGRTRGSFHGTGLDTEIERADALLADDDSSEDDKSSSFGDSSSSHRGEYSSESSASPSASSGTNGDGSMLNNAATGKNEEKNVLRSKMLVYIVLALAAAGMGYAVYHFLKAEEINDFEVQFENFAQEIRTSAESNAEDFLGKLKTVSNTLTSYSLDTGHSWPNVTLPHFDIRTTDSFEKLAGAELFMFAPLVTKDTLQPYQRYAWDHQGWIKEDLELRGLGRIDPGYISPSVYSYYGDLEDILSADMFVPIWEVAPVPTNAEIINFDLYSHPSFKRMIDEAMSVKHIMLSEVFDRSFLTEKIETLDRDAELDAHPRSYAIQPVFQTFDISSDLVGFVFAVVPWWTYFVDVLPLGTEGFIVEVQDTCGSQFFYRLDGPEATYLGQDFEPNPDFEDLAQTQEFAEFARYDGSDHNDYTLHCSYRITIHPSDELKGEYESNDPWIYTIGVLCVFLFTILVFVLYDFFVQKRQRKVETVAQKTTAIVASLFPKNVQRRIMQQALEEAEATRRISSGKDKLRKFLGNDEKTAEDDLKSGEILNEEEYFKTKPIADFFPDTSIMFADIVGFTAWSSTREPSQVFILLETIYHQFDEVAKQRRIFKVETVGDCYVAVAGLPDPRKDHALAISKFARECLARLDLLTKRLEISLGPDTADLAMRIGIHSGPVTAGVLRGERARFQLFGDTMNTASRMESTGKPNMIQISQETADCLKRDGKSHWISSREDRVDVKGKGKMQTYFLEVKDTKRLRSMVQETAIQAVESDLKAVTDSISADSSSDGQLVQILDSKLKRLIDWNVDGLLGMLQKLEARRRSTRVTPASELQLSKLERQCKKHPGKVISEVQEIITLPEFKTLSKEHDANKIVVDRKATDQLYSFIEEIAMMYRDNPFHNFEHASHVVMSVAKLFSRVITPDQEEVGGHARSLHEHTYGITSDPLTQFSVMLSALIHDVDHPGVPNTQLTKEATHLSKIYDNKSIAEQNSVDLAWDLLMEHRFKDLRRIIYRTESEFKRFRQLLVNSVLATDIMDKDLKTLRNNRWDRAFAEDPTESESDQVNRKATIVIEHLMQASDVAHTMQHWHIYRKWNQRFFKESYKAYLDGRAEKDPSETWYKGELGFFDFYIIPLAKKLKDCGVFGVSSDEYLQYATHNRNEWERKGEAALAEYRNEVKGWKSSRRSSGVKGGDSRPLPTGSRHSPRKQ